MTESELIEIWPPEEIAASGFMTSLNSQGQPRWLDRSIIWAARRPLLETGLSRNQVADRSPSTSSASPIIRTAASVSATDLYDPCTLDRSRIQPSLQTSKTPPERPA